MTLMSMLAVESLPPVPRSPKVKSTSHSKQTKSASQNKDPIILDPTDPAAALFLKPAPLPLRSSSFRSESKPRVQKVVQDDEMGGTKHSSFPNLLFPKDDSQLDINERDKTEVPLRRVRSFKTTSKGVVNRGDSFRKKNAHRYVGTGWAVDRDNPQPRGMDNGQYNQAKPVVTVTQEQAAAMQDPDAMSSYFRVVVKGAPGVGKTSITNLFMTSEYTDMFESMISDDEEKTVTVQVDGEEATMEFIDATDNEDYVDEDEDDNNADAFIIVYSITDRRTFDTAVDALYRLRHGLGTDRPILLVGNKIDLVRKRKVPAEDAKSISRTYDCKHWETSAALNHHVDELLVAVLKYIRHRLDPVMFPLDPETEIQQKPKKSRIKGPKGFFIRLFRKYSKRGKPRSDAN